MSTKFEKKSKRKFEMKPKCFRVRSRNPRTSAMYHYQHVGPYDWLPIPKELYPAYLADIAAAAKARAEGKPIDKNIWNKYFRVKPVVHRSKPLANWKQLDDYWRERDAARVKANALKRKMKKAYHMKKEQPLLNKTELMTEFARVVANALKRKEKEAYPMKKEQQLLDETKLTDFARFRLTL
ncbi:hypothetical protein A2U01_0001509 [Trifolium medium]|uniref:Uncharacterized protein n=3 Tax=Trifolium TaxID=3898 RepID=A0A2K3NUT2_TRIPR|nr:uncharacterized protein LOC123882184 [Trifolium pratense]MCH80736.1 hypothetical protein [Trifolium medium]PNY06797.1 hypothetical protein L195_g003275 [Trifolium pratense]CAJ2653250.1 unnamed protein product [Trifolium pratense]